MPEIPSFSGNVRPKKQLGQHFLTDLNIARKIAGALKAAAGEKVIEIGPGTGVLTRILIETYPKLELVEIDPEAVSFLKNEFEDKHIPIHPQSFLEWEIEKHLKEPAWFIGNLPYNISSPIFFHLLENLDWVKGGVFMVQKEVAQRISSKHGSKEYGILSVLMQTYFDVKYEFSVSENVFFPRPNVKSGVFSVSIKKGLPEIKFNILKNVVKTAFNQRRKTLRNALSGLHFREDERMEKWMSMRAEQLSVAEFTELAGILVV